MHRVKLRILHRAEMLQRRLRAEQKDSSEPSARLVLFVALFVAVLVMALAGCATLRTGNETEGIVRNLGTASAATVAARSDAKEVMRLSGSIGQRVGSSSNLQRRIDFKTQRALRILDR